MVDIYPSMIEHLKHYGYILVPLLYISNMESLKWTLFSLLSITVINSGLSFLGAIGMGPSFVQAVETTRIPGLLRARGPLENLGDTALLLSFMTLLIWTASRHKIQFEKGSVLVKGIILLVMVAGVIATQSRNVILSISLVFTVYYWLRMMMQGKKGGINVLLSLTGVVVFLVAMTFVILNADAIISWVTSMFGVRGEGTVKDRLNSYKHAITLLDGSLFLGLTPGELKQNALFIAKLHNVWLGMALFSGLLGVILVFTMIIFCLLSGLRLIRNTYLKEYGLVFTSFILAALWFSPNFYPGHNAFLFWFCIGFGLTARQTLYFVPKD